MPDPLLFAVNEKSGFASTLYEKDLDAGTVKTSVLFSVISLIDPIVAPQTKLVPCGRVLAMNFT